MNSGGPPVAVIGVVLVVIICIIICVIMATMSPPSPAAVTSPSPAAVTSPSPAAVTSPAPRTVPPPPATVPPPPATVPSPSPVGVTSFGGQLATVPTGSSPASSMGREVVVSAVAMTPEQQLAAKQYQAAQRAADYAGKTQYQINEELAQAQRDSGKKADVRKS